MLNAIAMQLNEALQAHDGMLAHDGMWGNRVSIGTKFIETLLEIEKMPMLSSFRA